MIRFGLEGVLNDVRKKGVFPEKKHNHVALYYGDGCYAEVPCYKETIEPTAALFLYWLVENKGRSTFMFKLDTFCGKGRKRVFTDTKRCLYSAMTAKSVKETWRVFLWRRDNLYSVEFVDDYDYYMPFGFRVADMDGKTYDFPMATVMEEEGLFSLSDYFNGTALGCVIDRVKKVGYENNNCEV